MKNKRIILLSFLILSLVFIIQELRSPFRFAEVKYTKTIESFDKSPNQLSKNYNLDVEIPLNNKRNKDIIDFIQKFDNYSCSKSQFMCDMKMITRATQFLMSRSKGNVLREKTTDFITVDPKFKSICSEASKLTVVFAQSLGYAGRVVWLNGHTVSEIFYQKHGWVMIDTYGNVMFKSGDRLLSMAEITIEYSNSKVQNIVRPNYLKDIDYLETGYLNRNNNVYSNQDLLIVLRGKDLLTVHRKSRNLFSIIQSVLNIKPYAYGIQYVGENRKRTGNLGLAIYKRLNDK